MMMMANKTDHFVFLFTIFFGINNDSPLQLKYNTKQMIQTMTGQGSYASFLYGLSFWFMTSIM